MNNFILLVCALLLVGCVSQNQISRNGKEPIADDLLSVAEEIEESLKDFEAEDELEGERQDKEVSETSQELIIADLQPVYALSKKEIEYQVLELLSKEFVPVVDQNNNFYAKYYDIFGNRYDDLFLLLVKNDETLTEPTIAADVLQDITNLFDDDSSLFNFYLGVFFQLEGNIVPVVNIPIGEAKVLKELETLKLHKQYPLPFGVAVSFKTRKGIDWRWIFFSRYDAFSSFNIKETMGQSFYVEDVNYNGLVDFVLIDRVFEESIGFETYLTKYSWDGYRFKEISSTNIVRNLNSFMQQISAKVQKQGWSAIFPEHLAENLKSKMEKEAPLEIAQRVFFTEKDENDDHLCNNIRALVFPHIFENPFSFLVDQEKSAVFSVRINCYDYGITYKKVKIGIDINPFEEPQYFFIVDM